MGLPFQGVKVVELAQSLGSPYCTSMMSDYGADVIKIEPRQGDRVRNLGTIYFKGENSMFFSLNRGKRGITVDISKREGQEIVKRLAAAADVVTENYRPGVLERWGVGYEALSRINPRLIYLSITGFGAKGPWSDRPGIELLFQAYSGLMSMQPPDENGRPRQMAGAVSDMAAGVFAFMGIAMALYEREKSGRGQRVDVSNLNSTLSMFSPHAQGEFFGGRPKGTRTTIVPFRAFKTKDSYIAIGIPNQVYWPNLCKALGIEDLRDNPLFATILSRAQNQEATETLIETITEQKTTAEWLEIFKDADALGAPINTYADLPSDPQILANDMIVTVDHPIVGTMKMIGIPIKLSRTPGTVKGPPPTLGQHAEQVLQELGYGRDEIEDLRRLEVI